MAPKNTASSCFDKQAKGTALFKLSRSTDKTSSKTLSQKLFSRSSTNTNKSGKTLSPSPSGLDSPLIRPIAQVQPVLLPNGSKDFFIGLNDVGSTSSPPHYENLRRDPAKFEGETRPDLYTNPSASTLISGTNNWTTSKHVNEEDTEFLRAVLNLSEDSTSNNPFSLSRKRCSKNWQQPGRPSNSGFERFPKQHNTDDRSRILQQTTSNKNIADTNMLPLNPAVRIMSKSHTHVTESDSEDDYGSEESECIPLLVEFETEQQLDNDGPICLLNRICPGMTSSTFAHKSRPATTSITAIGLTNPCQRALYNCTLLKVHVHLAPILLANPAHRSHVPIVYSSYCPDEIRYPRSANLASTLHQHSSTYNSTRDLRIALARSVVMRKLRLEILPKYQQAELAWFRQRHSASTIPSDCISQAILQFKDSNAETSIPRPFTSASRRPLIDLEHLNYKDERPKFMDRKENILPLKDTENKQDTEDWSQSVSVPFADLVCQKVTSSKAVGSKRLAPWLVYSDPGFPQTQMTAEPVYKIQTCAHMEDATNDDSEKKSKVAPLHLCKVIRDRVEIVPRMNEDLVHVGAKRVSDERRAAIEAYKLNKSRQLLQEARDRRALTRHSMLLAEPNYGAGSPLLGKPTPRKESALGIAGVGSAVTIHCLSSEAPRTTHKSPPKGHHLSPKIQRLRTSSLTPRRENVERQKISPIATGLPSPMINWHQGTLVNTSSYHRHQHLAAMMVSTDQRAIQHSADAAWSRQQVWPTPFLASSRLFNGTNCPNDQAALQAQVSLGARVSPQYDQARIPSGIVGMPHWLLQMQQWM